MSDKKWSLKTVILYGINCVIGSGIFLLPGSAYKLLGPGSLLAYLFVFILKFSSGVRRMLLAVLLSGIISFAIIQRGIIQYWKWKSVRGMNSEKPSDREQELFSIHGTWNNHKKDGKGGCVIKSYDAFLCSKCSDVKVGELKNVIIHKSCPH